MHGTSSSATMQSPTESIESTSSSKESSAGGSPPTSRILVIPGISSETEASDFVDNYELDGADESDYTLSEKMVHYLGGRVMPEHWVACKAVLVFHAGSMTSKLPPMTKSLKLAACLRAYTTAIDSLDRNHFCAEACSFFLHSFRKKDEAMTPEALYRYYLDSRSKMRSCIIPLLPSDFNKMKSGKGFHDTCNDAFVQQFRNEIMKVKKGCGTLMTQEEADQELPPPYWEYKKSPWWFGLAVKIFRRDPQLAPIVTDVMEDAANVPQSRAMLKRQKEAMTAVKMENHDNASQKRTRNNKVDKKIVWAKVHTAKALEETANLGRRMGQLDELEKHFNLLDRMRGLIDEEQYLAGVRSIASAMPNPNTFNEAVVVNLLDDDENDDIDDHSVDH